MEEVDAISTDYCDFESDQFTEFTNFGKVFDPFNLPLIPEAVLSWTPTYYFPREWIVQPTWMEQPTEKHFLKDKET